MNVPSHVPRNLVFDFDFFNPGPENVQDPFLSLLALRQRPRVFWTPRNGGHWVFTRGTDISRVLNDTGMFSSKLAIFRGGGASTGFRLLPAEADPPEHGIYRKPLDRVFESRSLSPWLKFARKTAVELIEDIRPKGQCEFMAEFGRKFSTSVLLAMFDLPAEDGERISKWCLDTMRRPDQWGESSLQLAYYVNRLASSRFSEPGRDLMSKLLMTDFGAGRRMKQTEATGLIISLIGGGLNPLAASMGWAALFLARSPYHRAQLVAQPSLITNAVFELLRRFSPANLWRVVRMNLNFEGTEFRTNDRVLLPLALHGLDETLFERPTEVEFGRGNAAAHLGFCIGPHQCPGRDFSVQLLSIFIDEWLKRIPDFEIAPEDQPRVETLSWTVVTKLPLRWNPKPPPKGKRAR